MSEEIPDPHTTLAQIALPYGLSSAEGWTTPAHRPDAASEAWRHSWPALVLCEDKQIVAFVRALSDGQVTAYICELLVVPAWRGHGLGKLLIAVCHALQPTVRFDLLSTEEADGFYEHLDFRPFKGYRKSYF